MSSQRAVHQHSQALRHEAETRLKSGTAPSTRGWVSGAEALTLLHGLAGNPATAGDARKLLHELQVHQVELDLQHLQTEQTRSELAETLARYFELYDLAPVGYFTVDPQGRIIEGNLAGASLLGLKLAESGGRDIGSFLVPQSRPVLMAMLQRLSISGSRESCEVQCGNGGRVPRRVQVAATGSRSRPVYFLAMMDASDRNPADPAH